jgi:hypothetical protein
MPIRINLLAEAQALEESRRKDPVKRAIWIGGFAVFCVLLWSMTLQFKIIVVRSDIGSTDVKWKSIEKQVTEVNDHRNRTRDLESKLSALNQFTTNRVLWARTLDALQHTPVDGVQLVRFRSEQSFQVNEGAKPAAPVAGVVMARPPATVIEKVVLTLEGKDYSLVPGEQVPHYKQSLVSVPALASFLQKSNTVQLTSQSAPQSEFGRTYVAFGLQLFFEQKERRLYE